jgi:hypothetical protein
MELRALDQQPGDAFVFMLGNAVFAQTGGAILAVEFLAMENFVPAFTAFDGSVDELKHKAAAQRNVAKIVSKLGRSHLRLSTVVVL